MRSPQASSAGWFVDSGRWELLVAIVLGLLLTVGLGRAASAALAYIAPGDHVSLVAQSSSPAAP